MGFKVLSETSLAKLIQKIRDGVYNSTNTDTIEIDSTVTENSDNLITSGAVFDVVGDVVSALQYLGGNSPL